MPSDERVERVMQALAPQRDAFQSALGNTVEQVRTFLHEHQSSGDGHAGRISAELGPFAAGRIDTDRFTALMGNAVTLDTLTAETIAKARDTMAELAARNHHLFLADVPSGGDVRAMVGFALEEIGRAFGAVRIFELNRSGSYYGNEHARSLGSFPFHKWSKGERRLAPPLVVTVDGADLRAEALAEFLDGAQKIALIVRGECAPAPLVRLITPGTFVVQTTDVEEMTRLAAWEGPGVGALVPDRAARFVHDPAAGAHVWERLTIGFVPDQEPRLTIGGKSGRQQTEELRQLKALASRPAAGAPEPAASAAAPVTPAAPADPVDKLAAWLLRQADLSDLP